METSLYQQLFEFGPSKADRVRMEIIEAAIRILAKEGVSKLTFELIGQKLGRQPSSIKYYFPDKMAVVRSAIQMIALCGQECTKKSMNKASTSKERIFAIARGAFQWAKKYPQQLPAFLYLYYDASINSPNRELAHRIRSEGRLRIATELTEIGFSKDKVKVLSAAIQSLITGELFHFISTKGDDLETHLNHTLLAIEVLLGGDPS